MMKSKEAILSLCAFLALRCSGLLCNRGYFLFEASSHDQVCKLCPRGAFMTHDQHTHKECHPCTEIHDPSSEITVQECNRTHDGVIICHNGFYRNKEIGLCVKCSDCDGYTALPCKNITDTVCCPSTNYQAVLNPRGTYECQKRQTVCGKGQFVNSTTGECVACPSNTFMPKDNHNLTGCINCRTPKHNTNCHEVVKQRCTSNQPSQFVCANGYFIDHQYATGECQLACSKCTTCLHEGQPCHHDNDSVCCPQSNMVVIEAEHGHECTNSSKTVSEETTVADKIVANEAKPTLSCFPNDSGKCPPKWQSLVPGKCLKLENAKSYTQAVESCSKQGAYLLEEDLDAEIYACITDFFQVQDIWLKQKQENMKYHLFKQQLKEISVSMSQYIQYPSVCVLNQEGVVSAFTDTDKTNLAYTIIIGVPISVGFIILVILIGGLLRKYGKSLKMCVRLFNVPLEKHTYENEMVITSEPLIMKRKPKICEPEKQNQETDAITEKSTTVGIPHGDHQPLRVHNVRLQYPIEVHSQFNSPMFESNFINAKTSKTFRKNLEIHPAVENQTGVESSMTDDTNESDTNGHYYEEI